METREGYKVGLSEEELRKTEELLRKIDNALYGVGKIPYDYLNLEDRAAEMLTEIRRLQADNERLSRSLDSISEHLGKLLHSLGQR